MFNRTVALKDSWAKVENKNQPKKQNNVHSVLQKDIMPLTGKYLKARVEEERLDLIAKVFDFSKQVKADELVEFVKAAASNKDFLTALMIFNSKNVSVDFENKMNFDLMNLFVGKALLMKNSYVRFQAVDFIGKYLEFKNTYLDLLKTMAIEDKNTHVVERLKDYL